MRKYQHNLFEAAEILAIRVTNNELPILLMFRPREVLNDPLRYIKHRLS